MAPKRSRKVVSVKKIVQETVEVAVVKTNDNNQNEIKENEFITSGTTQEEHIIKTIAVKHKTTQQQEEEDEVQTQKETPEEEETQTQRDSQEVTPASEKKVEGKKRKTRRKKTRFDQVQGGTGREEYKRYVFMVLKQVHPGMRISSKAMTVVNNMMNDMFERLADESAKLAAYTGKMTLSSREVQGAVRLVLPGDLGRHAIAEGAKAVAAYMSSNGPSGSK